MNDRLRRLGNPEPLGGPPDMPFLGDVDNVAEMAKLHRDGRARGFLWWFRVRRIWFSDRPI